MSPQSRNVEKEPAKLAQRQKSTRKKRKKQKKNKKKSNNQIQQSLANTMASWAENFTMAATWQLKHQLAMWKSRATALEYENQILRNTLQQFYVNGGISANSGTSTWDEDNNFMEYEKAYTNNEPSVSAYKENSNAELDSSEESEIELEISDEYMAFLRQNFEYRQARDERKKRQADEEKVAEVIEPERPNDRIDEYKELYGDCWQRVVALDCHLSEQFMSLCDSEKPGYWPNIPLRF